MTRLLSDTLRRSPHHQLAANMPCDRQTPICMTSLAHMNCPIRMTVNKSTPLPKTHKAHRYTSLQRNRAHHLRLDGRDRLQHHQSPCIAYLPNRRRLNMRRRNDHCARHRDANTIHWHNPRVHCIVAQKRLRPPDIYPFEANMLAPECLVQCCRPSRLDIVRRLRMRVHTRFAHHALGHKCPGHNRRLRCMGRTNHDAPPDGNIVHPSN